MLLCGVFFLRTKSTTKCHLRRISNISISPATPLTTLTMLTKNFNLAVWDDLIDSPLSTTFAIENRKLDKRVHNYVSYLGNLSLEEKEELELFGSVVLYTEPESWHDKRQLRRDIKEFRGFLSKRLPVVKQHKKGRELLIEDILQLALSQLESIKNNLKDDYVIRLDMEFKHDEGCCQFHIDKAGIRALVCYFGPSTEVVDLNYVDLKKMRSLIEDDERRYNPEEFNLQILKKGYKIHQPNAGDLLLLRGEFWKGAKEYQGAVHRSPPISPTLSTKFRLLVRVDHLLKDQAVEMMNKEEMNDDDDDDMVEEEEEEDEMGDERYEDVSEEDEN